MGLKPTWKSTMLAMRALVLAATACSAAGFAGAPSALPSMTPAKAMQGAFRRAPVLRMQVDEARKAAVPLVKVASDGMGLIKPLFVAEALLQALVLGKLFKVSKEDVIAEIEQKKAENPCVIYTYKLSPFSTEALALLDASGYEYTNIELGLEWFALGGRGSQTRVALAEMCENGASSLPKIFIGGKPLGGASGFSALADVVERGELDGRMQAAGAKKL